MRIFLGTALAALMLVINPALAETINTHTGTVEGITHNDISAFLGIPYAAPPVGENRWRAPQPPASWKGTLNATQFGSDCAQAPFPAGSIPGLQTEPDEDCLFVNVWKPAGAKQGDALPVLVWIHGGGFVYGGSSQSVYSGENFARDGLVFVSLNYRLGRFGFFAHPALADEGVGTNFAVLDQIAALRWGRDNIASFGGDPAQVTVFGESTGGMSVHMLLQTPLALGLFQGAIIESGAGRNESIPYKDIPSAAASGLQFSPAKQPKHSGLYQPET